MEVEKEVRFSVDDKTFNMVKSHTEPHKEEVKMLDITLGAYGWDSLMNTGRIFRIRKTPTSVKLEVKLRTSNKSWVEESIKLDSVNQGINFLTLSGLKPYLYIDRTREVRRFNNLKIFLDDIDTLGKFVEVEYQDSPNAETELNAFLLLFGIKNEPRPLYGDIMRELYYNDTNYKQMYDQKLNSLIDTASKYTIQK